MIRNSIFFIVALIILCVVTLFDINYLNYKAPILYSNLDDITWDDFRGFNRPFQTLNGEQKFAFISTEIEADYNDDGNIQIVTYFHPSRSYVFNNNILDRALLKHELYHFHIAEILARRMRQELPDKAKSKVFNLASWQSSYQQKEDSMQHKYDSQTYHGYLSNKQVMWQERVDSILLATTKYSNPTVVIN